MNDSNPTSTPCDVSQKLTTELSPKSVTERKELEKLPYHQAVGSLLFLAQVSRPDIQYVVNSVSRFNSNPGRAHWEAVKRIVRYLKGSIDKKWTY